MKSYNVVIPLVSYALYRVDANTPEEAAAAVERAWRAGTAKAEDVSEPADWRDEMAQGLKAFSVIEETEDGDGPEFIGDAPESLEVCQ